MATSWHRRELVGLQREQTARKEAYVQDRLSSPATSHHQSRLPQNLNNETCLLQLEFIEVERGQWSPLGTQAAILAGKSLTSN